MFLPLNFSAEIQNNLGQLFDVKSKKLYSKSEIIREILYIQDRLENEFDIKSGDRVILKNGNNSHFFFQLLALWQMGAVAIPTSDRILDAELAYISKETAACLIVEKHNFIKIGIPTNLKASTRKNEALILFTSGTTAQPKGVVFDLPSIIGKVKALSQYIPKEEFAKTLCMLPTNFGHGLIGNSLFPLLNGGELYIMPPLDLITARSISKLIEFYKITFFSTVPSFWPLLLNSDKIKKTSLLQRVHCASARLNPQWVKNIKNWIGNARLFNVYGTTETLSWIGAKEIDNTFSESEINEFWCAEFSLEKNDILTDRKEILVDTKFQFSYYLNNSIKTINEKSEDEKFLTGDLGYINSRQEFVICGRKDTLINKGGLKISPDEIDALLLKIPGIQDACTFAYSDSDWGDKVGVAIVRKIESEKVGLSEKNIFDMLSKELSVNKIPDKIWFVLSIPRDNRGKLIRENLKHQVINNL